MTVLRAHEFLDARRPHRTVKQAAQLRPLPDNVTGLLGSATLTAQAA